MAVTEEINRLNKPRTKEKVTKKKRINKKFIKIKKNL